MRIAIVGAGAIGTWLGVRLGLAGHAISVLARGATREAIVRDGLRLTVGGESFQCRAAVSDAAEALGPQDVVIVAVKGPALPEVAESVAAMFHEATAVLPAMNGVTWWFTEGLEGPLAGAPIAAADPDGRIARAIPTARVVGCVVHASASLAAPAHAIRTGGNRLIIGEPRGSESERLARLRDGLVASGIEVDVSARIHTDVWYKLWGNMTLNPISAITGALLDRIVGDPLVTAFVLSVMAEAKEIGQRIGCPIAEGGEDRLRITRRLGGIKTSMLQDVEAHRTLEIDALLAAPREIAARVGVSTPNMDALHGLVRLFAASHGL
jgi:2-dehydropantoate 2-reductase